MIRRDTPTTSGSTPVRRHPRCVGAAWPSGVVSFVAPPAAEMAARFPELRVHALVGRGAISSVYRVYCPSLHRHGALKILPEEMAGDRTLLQRFEIEAAVLRRISHPSVPGLLASGSVGAQPFLLMEFIEGKTLAHLLAEEHSLPAARALRSLGRLAATLSHLHRSGVVHGDVGPQNVIIDRRGDPILIDFGLSRIQADSVTPAGDRDFSLGLKFDLIRLHSLFGAIIGRDGFAIRRRFPPR